MRSLNSFFHGRWGLLAVGAAVLCLSARADDVLLQHGGLLQGELRQPVDARYELVTPTGIRLAVPAAAVREIRPEAAARRAYHQRAPTVPDTVAGHWDLAQWCQQHNLTEEREGHLRRITELDPDYAPAWKALGFSWLNGHWVRRNDEMRELGYVFYEGKWRLAQEAALLESQRQAKAIQVDWFKRFRRWRTQLASERAALALQELSEVTDPAALPALADSLQREKLRPIKLLYLKVLRQIEDPRVIDVYFTLSLSDPDEEIFHACLEPLKRHGSRPDLRKAYVDALRGPHNWRVNRAAYALGHLGDIEVVSPLIDALITPHVVPLSWVAKGDLHRRAAYQPPVAVFAEGPGLGLQTGNDDRTVVVWQQNPQVHDALLRLCGVSFNYDQQRWRHWYAAKVQSMDAAFSAVDSQTP